MGGTRFGRLIEVFDAVCDLAANERPDRLAALCDGDDDLRAEVERMLAHDHEPTWADELLPAAPPDAAAGYERLGVLGRGGMGIVLRVRDRKLGRTVAMKVLRPELAGDPGSLARFAAEARIVAQLEHPGLVPLYDHGELPDGRPWFTMPEVKGRTLHDVLRAVHAAADGTWRPTPDGWTFRRLVEVFRRACEAIAHAHARGVVHRDLKPANVLVGPFGEALVVDWGIARVAGAHATPSPVTLTDSGVTRASGVVGTPSYMAPEQARGDEVGPRTDVWALGATLYELLSGAPPYTGTAAEVVAALWTGPPPSVRTRLHAPVPDVLCDLCDHALAYAPELRPSDAGEVAAAVAAWLQHDHDRERALAVVTSAAAHKPVAAALRSEARRLRDEARDVLRGVAPSDPVEAKLPGWRLEARATAADSQARLEELEWLRILRRALDLVPDLPEAHDELAAHYREVLVAAEARRDPDAAAEASAMVRAHDRGHHAAFLAGAGHLELTVDPPGATVTVSRIVEQDRRLVEIPVADHPAPLDLPLARGSWSCRIAAPGRETVVVPVAIGRGTRCTSAVSLPPAGALGPDDILVPGGPVEIGGDPEAADAWSHRRVHVDPFVIRRHPVTVGEYLGFLNDVGDLDRAPRAARGDDRRLVVRRGGPLVLDPDPDGVVWDPRQPVTLVSWHDAAAFAAWLAATTGAGWRLVHSVEREKAARGADGRWYPWGDWFDPTWANMADSRAGPPRRTTVDEFPGDSSPYGVRGLAGNVRDWCLDAYSREGPGDRLAVVEGTGDLRTVCGGSWTSKPPMCRSAARFANRPDQVFPGVGFRLARSA